MFYLLVNVEPGIVTNNFMCLLLDNLYLGYKVYSTTNFPGSWVSDFSGKPHAWKFNKAQTNLANITGVQYFCGIFSCLSTHQQEWCQLHLIIYPLFIILPHNMRQLTFLRPPLPLIECATTNIVRLQHQQITPHPWFGQAYKRIWSRGT